MPSSFVIAAVNLLLFIVVNLLLFIYQSHLIVVSVVRPREVVERLEGDLGELLEGVLRELL